MKPGASSDLVNDQGYTALKLATRKGYSEIAQALQDAGDHLNLQAPYFV